MIGEPRIAPMPKNRSNNYATENAKPLSMYQNCFWQQMELDLTQVFERVGTHEKTLLRMRSLQFK